MVAIRAVSLTAAPYIGLKYPNLVVTRYSLRAQAPSRGEENLHE
jgi:hypothetical protein